MSLMSYTYESGAFDEEITLTITMPEKSSHEILPFETVILVPDAKMESNFFMRKEPLERYCCGQIPLATVSLPGRVTIRPLPILKVFLIDELPSLLGQFPLKISAVYAKSLSSVHMVEIMKLLKECYTNLIISTQNEPLKDFFDDLQEQLLS